MKDMFILYDCNSYCPRNPCIPLLNRLVDNKKASWLPSPPRLRRTNDLRSAQAALTKPHQTSTQSRTLSINRGVVPFSSPSTQPRLKGKRPASQGGPGPRPAFPACLDVLLYAPVGAKYAAGAYVRSFSSPETLPCWGSFHLRRWCRPVISCRSLPVVLSRDRRKPCTACGDRLWWYLFLVRLWAVV